MTLAATIPLKHDIPFTPLLMAKPRRTDVLAARIIFLLCQTYYPTKKPVFKEHHHLAGNLKICLISFTSGLE